MHKLWIDFFPILFLDMVQLKSIFLRLLLIVLIIQIVKCIIRLSVTILCYQILLFLIFVYEKNLPKTVIFLLLLLFKNHNKNQNVWIFHVHLQCVETNRRKRILRTFVVIACQKVFQKLEYFNILNNYEK